MVRIELDRCDGCGECVEACAEDALVLQGGSVTLRAGRCTGCDACVAICPRDAIRPLVVQGAVAGREASGEDAPGAPVSRRVVPVRQDARMRSVEVRDHADRALTWTALGPALVLGVRALLPRLATLAGDVMARDRAEAPRLARGERGHGRRRRERRRGR